MKRPGKPVFVVAVRALTGPAGTDVSLAVSSRKPVCRVPNALRGVAVRVGDRTVKTLGNVPAPRGRAAFRVTRLERGERLRVWVTVHTRQTPKPHLLSARSRTLLRPDLTVRLEAPLSALVAAPFTVRAETRERNGDVAASGTATLSAGGVVLATAAVRSPAGGRTTAVLSATLAALGTQELVVAISNSSPGETDTANNASSATVAITVFRLATAKELVPSLVGYGAQFNQHVYAAISRSVGVTEENVREMEDKVVALGPQFVRLFFHPIAFTDLDEMQSFVRSVQLAQRAGATINVTWQATGLTDAAGAMSRFAALLADLVRSRGVTRLRWVTVQNEVNSTRITMAQYEQLYRRLDEALRTEAVRSQIRLMGGDLVGTVSPLGQTQEQWFAFLASRMADILDAYSVHVYWDYRDTARLVRRLTEVRQIYDTLPAAGKRPLYVTEFSARGIRDTGGQLLPDPGVYADGTPIAQTNINAFQHAWFNVLASRLGYYGTIKWDAYFAKYDRGTQVYSMIGSPQEGWPLRPAYHLTRLFTQATAPGWKVVSVDGSSGTQLLTGYTGTGGSLALVGLDTAGATLNAASPAQVAYNIGGLPPATRFQLLVWNLDGSGRLTPAGSVSTDAAGVLNLTVPLHSVFAVTTR